MVGPSISDEDRDRLSRRLRVGFVLTVALSGALVALYAGGGPPVVAVAALGGGLVGVALMAYLAWIGGGMADGGRQRGRNP